MADMAVLAGLLAITIPDVITDRLSTIAMMTGGILVLMLLLSVAITPRLSSAEPKLVKPSIPLIGHIINIVRKQNSFHYDEQVRNPVAAASLQMLWGKLYGIWDPTLAHSVMRSRDASFDPIIVERANDSLGLAAISFAKVTDNPCVVRDYMNETHKSLSKYNVQKMNARALNFVGETLNTVGSTDEGLIIPNLYKWLREVVSVATCKALLGKENPFDKDPSLIEDFNLFEEHNIVLSICPYPSLLQRPAYLARNRLQAAFGEYYTAEHDVKDDTVAEIIRVRANLLRRYGFTGTEVGQFEIMTPFVAVTNTSPSLFWLITFVFARPELVQKLKEEAMRVIHVGDKANDSDVKVALINISKYDTCCPLHVACYKETQRLVNEAVVFRRILEDVTVKSGDEEPFLLKKGVDVQIPAGIFHRSPSAWGDDASEFRPERFLESKSTSPASGKAKKNAYMPFGGGRHLCPGRDFAFAELMAIMSTLVVGYELQPIGSRSGFENMGRRPANFSSAIVKPVDDGEGLGIKLTKGKGWEDTKWTYTT